MVTAKTPSQSVVKKRLNICMPLDYIAVTSSYGYRKDPFTKCQKFHDGIDLRYGNGLVYSMLPGRVTTVHYGDTGYGNNSWTSVDPLPFIHVLNEQVESFNRRLEEFSGNNTPIYYNVRVDNKELTIENLYAALKKHGIKYPKIVLAQAILETGRFSSRVCNEHNNLFGLRHSKGYYSFDHWEESVIAYRDKVQYKHRDGEGYYFFLKRIGYASAPDYINKVNQI